MKKTILFIAAIAVSIMISCHSNGRTDSNYNEVNDSATNQAYPDTTRQNNTDTSTYRR